jgi:hypothetical protein
MTKSEVRALLCAIEKLDPDNLDFDDLFALVKVVLSTPISCELSDDSDKYLAVRLFVAKRKAERELKEFT